MKLISLFLNLFYGEKTNKNKTLSISNMKAKTLDKLVGCRFTSLEDLKDYLKNLGVENPDVFESDSDLTAECDFMLDGTIKIDSDDDKDYFTLHYLRDRSNFYYITETNFWS